MPLFIFDPGNKAHLLMQVKFIVNGVYAVLVTHHLPRDK
jgi:hypothetical protein